MEFVPVVVLAALVKKATDTIKYITNGDVNAFVTQLVVWAIGIAFTILFAHSDFGNSIEIAGTNLSGLNVWSQVLVGLNVASVGSVGWDAIKAFDNTDSAATPSLLPVKKANTAPVVKANAAEAAAN